MEIRKTQPSELSAVMDIYAHARKFMASTGNATQWGDSWPPRELIESDIAAGKSRVCVDGDRILAVFFYDFGENAEPDYDVIYDGEWLGNGPYGCVHRIATSSEGTGAGRFCLDWAFRQSGDLRIDTHENNKVMQHALTSLGFVYCGMVRVKEDTVPRMAFERLG